MSSLQLLSIRRLAAQAAVASASALLLVGGVGYVLSPAPEAIAAFVSSVSSSSGHEAIEGRVQGGWSGKMTVHVLGPLRGSDPFDRAIKVGRTGRFSVQVKPGHYTVVIRYGSKRRTERVAVTSNHSVFIVVKVTGGGGGIGLAPVIFNY